MLESLIKETRSELVRQLLGERRDDLQLLTQSQVCGILDVTPATLNTLPIPKITIVLGKVVRYLASDVAEFLKSRRA